MLAVGGLAAAMLSGGIRPPSRVELQVLTELGPIDGWRCLRDDSYVYQPNHTWPASGLLAEAPESIVQAAVANLEVERVEISLRSGEAVVWTRVAGDQRRVYVLAPGHLQVVYDRESSDPTTICTSHLGDWQIVGEHALG